MKKVSKDAIYLIDGSSFLFRAYYGLRPLHTSKGIPVQATYGFCRMIKKIVDEFNPNYMVILWDSKGKTIRKEIYEEYKAQRQAPPSDLSLQKEQIVNFSDSIELCQIFRPGYEADDLIASVVNQNKKRDIVIITSDKDLYQLLSSYVYIYDPFKKEMVDKEKFISERGFSPENLLMYHSLLGDSSDNIPGVRGVGKKGAEALVKQFGTLEELYKNLDKVEKERIQNLLAEQKEAAYLSKDLFTLRTPEIKETLKDFEFDKNHWSNALDIFIEFEFKSLARGIKPSEAVYIQSEIDLGRTIEKKLPRMRAERAIEPVKKNWKCKIVDTKESLEELIKDLKKVKFFALDVETTGLKPLEDRLVGLSFAFDNELGYYVPVSHVDDDIKQLPIKYVLEKLKPSLESEKLKKTLHSVKFDRLVLFRYGIELRGIEFDSLLAANLVRKGWEKIGLKSLSYFYLQEPMRLFSDVIGKNKTFATVPMKEAAEYSAHDSLQTYKLKFVLEKKLNKVSKIKKIFYDLELPLCDVLYRMERLGILLKPEILKKLEKVIEKDLNNIGCKTLGAIGAQRNDKDVKINLNSPKQVEKLLFDELKLPVVKRGELGKSRSTDQSVLEELSKIHAIPGLILKYRELSKLYSTYVKPLQGAVNPETGRIHTTFSQIDAATGRLASYNPNLQNIPVGSGYGIKIRSAFVATRGKIFLSADYSQIELRVLAHISKDKNLKEAFIEDRDIHTETAAQIFDVSAEKITGEQRKVGKRINFSIMYGLTPYGLSKDLGVKQSDAKKYIESYFDEYPGVARWMDKVIEKAKKTGYVETYLGRRRYFPGLLEENRTLYEHARRAAINSPVQGSTAEIVKLAMISLEKALIKKGLKAQMLLQIHDEIIIELPKDEEDKVRKIVKNIMEQVVDWDVPLKVDIRTGENWEEITK
ncbi:DNA polymerase I [Candidatus Babeliales bacterium]|nr:DNA polymerase I [Candidatus Babeliales bacterium]